MTRAFVSFIHTPKRNKHDSPVEITTFGTPRTGISGRVGRTGHVGGEIRRVCSGVTVNKVEKKDISSSEPVRPTHYPTNATHVTGVD